MNVKWSFEWILIRRTFGARLEKYFMNLLVLIILKFTFIFSESDIFVATPHLFKMNDKSVYTLMSMIISQI